MGLWGYISNLGISKTDSAHDVRKFHLINQMCFIGTITTFFFIPYTYLTGGYHYFTVQLLLAILTALYFFFIVKRHFHFALYWTFFLIFVNVFYGSLEMPKCGVEYFLIPIGLMPFAVLDKKKVCVGIVIFTLIAFFTSYFLQNVYAPHHILSNFFIQLTFIIDLTTVFALCCIVIYQFKNVNSKYETVIHQQKLILEDKNKDITDSIKYARRIQRSLLKPEKLIDKILNRLQNEKPNE